MRNTLAGFTTHLDAARKSVPSQVMAIPGLTLWGHRALKQLDPTIPALVSSGRGADVSQHPRRLQPSSL